MKALDLGLHFYYLNYITIYKYKYKYKYKYNIQIQYTIYNYKYNNILDHFYNIRTQYICR